MAPTAGFSRRVSIAALVSWALLATAQLGWLPFTQHAWGFGLWSYLPPAAAGALAAAALALCSARARESVARAAAATTRSLRVLPAGVGEGSVLLAFGIVLWLLRERVLFGDSPLILFSARADSLFHFPEIGATWLMHLLETLRRSAGIPLLGSLAALSCACGMLTVWLLLRASRHLASQSLAPAAVLFVLSGGIVRIFAGHIEVYAVLIAAVSGYLWAALAYLGGRCPGWVPALALGMAVWTHAAAVCLLPSLALLPRLRDPSLPLGRLLRDAALHVSLAGAPVLGFLVATSLAGADADVARLGERVVEVLGGSPDPEARRWWVRGWGGEPSVGTDVVFLSGAQLKYLINAFHILAPATIPLLAALAVAAPLRLVATPAARFLGVAALPLAAYAFLLRPFWGPFDWDLFSMTALCLALLAAHVLLTGLARADLRQVLPWLVGYQLLFVTLPFLATGVADGRGSGPFRRGAWKFDLQKPATPPPPHIAPWL